MNRQNVDREICPHNEFCGGCSYQGVPYEEQLDIKEKEVRRLMDERGVRIGEFAPIQPSPSPYAYRNKMEYTFGDMEKGGPLTLGMHQFRRHISIVTVDQCQIVPADFNVILKAVLEHCREEGYRHYHKRRHDGLLRHLILRCGQNTGELLVNIVTTEKGKENGESAGTDRLDEGAFVKLLQELEDSGKLSHHIVGILHTIDNDPSDATKAQEVRILSGRDYYLERVLGLEFQVSAFSFFQTNVRAVERLYDDAVHLLDDYAGMTVLDLFCGTGTITQVMARDAKRAIGVELVAEAVNAARENAGRNGLTNCDFIAGDVFAVLDDAKRGILSRQTGIDWERPDVIVVDPPRAGIHEKALDHIIDFGVDQILYISCNPKTLAQNLYYFQYYGYQVDYLKPYDNFSFTRHVECCSLLVKTSSSEV